LMSTDHCGKLFNESRAIVANDGKDEERRHIFQCRTGEVFSMTARDSTDEYAKNSSIGLMQPGLVG